MEDVVENLLTKVNMRVIYCVGVLWRKIDILIDNVYDDHIQKLVLIGLFKVQPTLIRNYVEVVFGFHWGLIK